VSQACVSLVVRGVGRRSNEHHRRAADKRLRLPVIWLVAERNQASTADSERQWHTQQVSAFLAVVLVLVRQMRTREVGLAARRHAVTASCRTLGTLAHYTYTHCCKCTCRSSFSHAFSTTIEDVSSSQI
jgi:hypothetical protein